MSLKESIEAGFTRLALAISRLKESTPQPTDVQVFSTVGTSTWVKPAGAKRVEVIAMGGGAGGGSGARRATTSGRSGGGSGSGSAYATWSFLASAIGATESVTVGAGGAGGAAVLTDDINGNTGIAGGKSAFGLKFFCNGGGFASLARGGSTVAVAGASGAIGFPESTSYNALNGLNGTLSAGMSGSNLGGAIFGGNGGGGAGAAASSLLPANGGTASNMYGSPAGPGFYSASPVIKGGAAGLASSSATAAGNGNNPPTDSFRGGSGGGGGAYRTGMDGMAGGNGGLASGGGGGSASDNGFPSGAGGKGGDGFVVVITYF